MVCLLLPLLTLALTHAYDSGLRDKPIAGDHVSYLDGDWTAAGTNGVTIKGRVPGDLISDLQNSGQVGDPLYEKNWLNSTIWEKYNWTYSTTVDGPPAGMTRVLVFDGIKMGAIVKLNGHELFTAEDQFLRYTAELSTDAHQLTPTDNTLEVTFISAIDVGGRFMACTGGWDWAPYSNTFQSGAHTLSKGIWKSVYTVDIADVAISHVTTQVLYNGPYPTMMLQDGNHGGFTVKARVHLWAPEAATGSLMLNTEWVSTPSIPVTVPAGDSTHDITVNASASQIKLWWPVGLGEQPLYNVTINWISSHGSTKVSTSRRIGFRYAVTAVFGVSLLTCPGTCHWQRH